MIAAAALVFAAQAATTAPPRDVRWASLAAISFCQEAEAGNSTVPQGGELYQYANNKAMADALQRMHIHSQVDVPELIQQFAATTVSGRSGPSGGFVRIPASDGEVWVVMASGGLSACDIAVTKMPQELDLGGSLSAALQHDRGWKMINERASSETAPAAISVLEKQHLAGPQTERLRLTALRPEFSKPEGIQVEINLVVVEPRADRAVSAVAAPTLSGASVLTEVTTQVCQRFAAGDLAFGQSLEADNRRLADVKIATGLQNGTMERLGRQGIGLIAQSLIGERAAGSDTVVLAVGGKVPGCRSILLSKDAGPLAEQAASALVAAGWHEAPASNAPDTPLSRRMFVKRDAKGDPYLVNLFAGSLPQSDFRLMTTVNRVPSGVELPKGF